jgi:ABC-type cobalamin/Fe3+-siderophores transport systems, ATPase components
VSPSTSSIALHNVYVRFGARTVLHNIDLELSCGGFHGLIGPNGAGKSTLLGLFNGMTAASSGRVVFSGDEVSSQTVSKIRLDIAHVFQLIDIDPKIPISVYETVLAGTYGRLGLFKNPQQREKASAIRALENVGLLTLKDRPLGQLSGGERQKVAIARALAQEPKLLLLDEPTASLDWQAQRDILNLVKELQKHYAITVLMATHDLNAVATIADRVAMLKEGKILWTGDVEQAMDETRLSELYDVPITIYKHGARRVALF